MTLLQTIRTGVTALALFISPLLAAQATYTTGFEEPAFTLGDVNGQDGWGHLSNSPTKGIVEAAPTAGFGAQSLALRMRDTANLGVTNHLYSATIGEPAGETGSTVGGVVVASPESTFDASFWYRTPAVPVVSTRTDFRFAELNPSSKGAAAGDAANRYAQVRLFNTTNDASGQVRVEIGWYGTGGAFTVAVVAFLDWGEWYRFNYLIELIDGTDGFNPNDRFTLTIHDDGGSQVGTACGSTWELGWKSGTWGGGATPRAINGFDFWVVSGPNDLLAGHLDDLSMTAYDLAERAVTIGGASTVCANGTTTLSANASGGSGTFTNYVWRNASNTVVGNNATLTAGAGTYTVTATDTLCATATSDPFTVTALAPLTASISGTTEVCFGGTTTLTANASGGSGTITGYTWRDGLNAIVGTGSTLVAGAGIYSVTVTDASCGSALSNPVTVETTCKATPTVTWNDPADITYGTPLGATQLNATASVPGTFTYTPAAGTVLNAGENQLLSVNFAPTDSANYNEVNGTTVQIDVLQATPAVTVSGGPFTFDETPHAATAIARDANGNAVSGTFTFTYNGSATAPTNAGTYAVVATFTSADTNFTNATGNGTLTINAATPVVTVTGGTSTYDGAPHAATAVARDANGNVVSGTFTFTYNGSATAPTNAGTYDVVATFTSSDANFANATGNGTLTINAATPVVTVTGGTYTYDGTSHAASAVARDANGNAIAGTFSYTYNGSATAPTNAGTYDVVATFTSSDPNFANATGNGTLTINAATPVVTVTGGTYTYDGAPHAATAVARDANGNVVSGTFTFTYNGSATAPTNAGTYDVVATFTSSDPNFTNASGNGTLTINAATPAVTVTGGTYTYDGTPHAASAVARDANGNVVSGTFTFTYNGSATAPTNAGTYDVVATFTSTDSNFANATGNGTLTINAATPVVTVTGGTYAYDGTPHAASAVARDANGNVVSGTFTFTYNGSATAPTNAGTYDVVATFTSSDPNFTNATGNGTLVIEKATPVVSWSDPADIVYGTPLGAAQLNATADVAGTFTYTPAAGTLLNAGANQTLSVDFAPSDSANYNPVSGTTVQLTVAQAPTSITIVSLAPTPSTRGDAVTVSFALHGVVDTTDGSVTISDGVDSCTTSANASSCSITFTTTGIRTVVATYSGDANHQSSISPGVEHRVLEAEDDSATALLDGAATICAGGSAALRVRLTGEAPWTITWSDGVVETTSDSVHQRSVAPSQTTSYSITSLTDRQGAGAATGSARVTVRVVPAPAILGTPAVTIGEPVTLRATSGYASYQWFRNGTPIAGATSDALTFTAVAQSDLGNYTVQGTRDGCRSPASTAFSLVLLGLPVHDDAVIPVVGTARGFGGSLFRTTVHLVNATEDLMEGELTFIDAQLPKYVYRLEPGETRFIDDLLPQTFEGVTSANVRRLRGPLPVVVAHVFNAGGPLGTSGLIERAIPLGDTLRAGDRAVLVTPLDPVTTRFNVGLRSLTDGLTVRITRRNAAGLLLGTIERVLPPSTLIHTTVANVIGAEAGSNESLTFEIVAGRGVIYGAATDNGTNDPNMQIASRLGVAAGTGRYILPIAGAVQGAFNSRFATGLQLHNPSDAPITATLTFHPAGRSASANAPQLAIAIPPHATAGMDEVVTAMGAADFGSLDVVVSGAMRPVLLARIYSIAEAGQTSLMTELVPEEEALVTGESAAIVAPHNPAEMRFNIGIRSLSQGVRLTATVRNADGDVLRVVQLSYAPSYFTQTAAPQLLGTSLNGDESVTFTIDEGSAVIYGVWTDNVTQDPAMQYAARP